jgi:2-polyprenyl-3-methyl-5-hydroxy-6-metoxy-1,4-benzoquinol methylase
MRESEVEALNDRLAREYPIDDYYTRSPFFVRAVEKRRLAVIREFMGDVRGLAVAEVGSGGGHVLAMFPQAKLTAFDVSGVYLAEAKERLAGYDARFIKGEVDKLELPEASFDRVVCTEVLEHVVDPNAVVHAIALLTRPSGIAVITIPNDRLIKRLKSVLRRAPLRWFLGTRIDWGGDVYHLHEWSPDEFERFLATYFEVLERRMVPGRLLPLRACFRCAPAPG